MEIHNKTLLITGGTGSFGNAVLQRFLATDHFNEIRIFSRDEKKQDDMRNRLKSQKIKFFIGDIRDYDSIDLASRNVDYIFHAAALKQVPSCEFFPMQAVRTNVEGTQNVIRAAGHNGVKKVICLSTDKAAYPINAMGISKAMMERIAIAKAREQSLVKNGTKISVTRYGNVMCSRGSVIPFFINKICKGEPLTITDPSMTRFMMSLAESLKLVLFSFLDANQGDITVQKSPSSTVEELAMSLQRIFSSTSEIRIIGPRHGEKKHETLCSAEEMMKAIDCGGYYKVPADLRDHDYSHFSNEEINLDKQSYSSNNTTILSGKDLDHLLLQQSYVIDALKNYNG